MSPKIGRPKTDNPKEIRFSIRLDVKTNTNLTEYCEKNNISKGEVIRKGIQLILAENEK